MVKLSFFSDFRVFSYFSFKKGLITPFKGLSQGLGEGLGKGLGQCLGQRIGQGIGQGLGPGLGPKLNFLGHVIRAENEDPIKPVTAIRKKVGKRRVGNPSKDWVEEGVKTVWKKVRHQVGQSDRRHPFRKRNFRACHQQCLHILERATDKIF